MAKKTKGRGGLNSCPLCKSDDISAGDREYCGYAEMTQDVRCNKCGAIFTEFWKAARWELQSEGKPEAAGLPKTIPSDKSQQETALLTIGMTAGLTGAFLDCYVDFMQIRFPDETATNYAKEWAMRFLRKTAWQLADGHSKKVLREAAKKQGITLKELGEAEASA